MYLLRQVQLLAAGSVAVDGTAAAAAAAAVFLCCNLGFGYFGCFDFGLGSDAFVGRLQIGQIFLAGRACLVVLDFALAVALDFAPEGALVFVRQARPVQCLLG